MPATKATALDNARADAAQELYLRARAKARLLGEPTRDPVLAIYDNRIQRQARALLIDALCLSFGSIFAEEKKIVQSLRSIDQSHPDAHEFHAEMWETIEDIARQERDEAEGRI